MAPLQFYDGDRGGPVVKPAARDIWKFFGYCAARGQFVTTKYKADSVDTSTWLTRQQSCDLLDVSETTIKNWGAAGVLHPVKQVRDLPNGGTREVWVYDPHELAQVPVTRRLRAKLIPGDPGEVAARAFEMFDDGAAPREVVTRLRVTPADVEVLQEQWRTMGGSELILNRAAREELTRLVGPFDGVAGLVANIRAALLTKTATPMAENVA